MIISQEKIFELVEKENLIENFNSLCLEGAGYDLRAGKFYKIRGSLYISAENRDLPEVDEIKSDQIILKPDEYILVETMEKVNMPKDLIARILPRSTLFRGGCSLITAVVDPGYRGTLTLGLKNLSSCEFKLDREARIGQIVFERVEGKTILYKGKYQGGRVV